MAVTQKWIIDPLRKLAHSLSPMINRIGSCTISRELGRGGIGVVSLGNDTRLDRPVAIETEPGLQVSERRTVSTDMAGVGDFVPMYDVSFIMLKSTGRAAGQAPDLRVILNRDSE